jgi:hypothetical protein
MTKLPSTLILHKRSNGANIRYSQLSDPFTQMPLQKWLKAMTAPGTYTQTTPELAYAFEPLHDMWTDNIDDEDSSQSSTNTEPHDNLPPPPPEQPLTILEPQTIQLEPQPEETPTSHFDNTAATPRCDETTSAKTPAPTTSTTSEIFQESMLWPSAPQPNTSAKKALNKLYQSISDSTEKMYSIIGAPSLSTTSPKAHLSPHFSLAQAAIEASNPIKAKTAGIYKMRLWTQHLQDSQTRSMAQS